MLHRVASLGIAVLFVTMNLLLWRSEYAPPEAAGSEVSVATVWWKILTAPDNSALEVSQRGRYLGFIRWSPEVVDAASNEASTTDPEMADMVTRPVNYRIVFDGNVLLPGLSNRVRFDGDALLSPTYEWRQFRLSFGLRPDTWEFRSVAAEKTLRLKMTGGAGTFVQDFAFADLQNPETLLREFGGPVALALLAGSGLSAAPAATDRLLSLGLTWRARESRLQLGHSSIRCYRIETRLLDRHPFVILVSRAGEILKVELPSDVRITNQQLAMP